MEGMRSVSVVSCGSAVESIRSSSSDELTLDLEIGEWSPIVPRCSTLGRKSHLRDVYKITQPLMLGKTRVMGVVIKVSEAKERAYKMADWPSVEEVAYKISKLFKWSVVPKTKTFHEQSGEFGDQAVKSLTYRALWESLNKPSTTPVVITFQALIDGEPVLADSRTIPVLEEQIPMKAHHKAFLLGAVLGKKDARGDNVLRELATGSLIEIDNELLGAYGYDKETGILRRFETYMNGEIEESIIDEFLAAPLEGILAIREKYEARDVHVTDLWVLDYETVMPGTEAKDLKMGQTRKWEQICKNFYFMQEALRELREGGHRVTPIILEDCYQEKLLQFDRAVRQVVKNSGPKLKDPDAEIDRILALESNELEKLLRRR